MQGHRLQGRCGSLSGCFRVGEGGNEVLELRGRASVG